MQRADTTRGTLNQAPAWGTQIRLASFHSRITDKDQEILHAIQACYPGPRIRQPAGRDGARISTDGTGAANEAHESATGKTKSERMKSSKMKSGTTTGMGKTSPTGRPNPYENESGN